MKEMNINVDKEVKKVKEKSLIREILDWIICIVTAFLLAVLIKYFIFTPTLVKQTSMTPTIKDGERVLINRIVRTFDLPIYRGDIITFEMPTKTENGVGVYNESSNFMDFFAHDVLELNKISFIKRVIGVAGDHVLIKNGSVYVNDRELEEVYLNGTETPRKGEFYDVIVPDGYLFVMGDNRSGSSDSREFGCIPLDKVEGRVSIRLWPLGEFGKIDD